MAYNYTQIEQLSVKDYTLGSGVMAFTKEHMLKVREIMKQNDAISMGEQWKISERLIAIAHMTDREKKIVKNCLKYLNNPRNWGVE